ncbi:hypothetical protein [Bacillus chungangensis]|uniref:Uncharacterized protein n=1 Tax=Bacillus chungangensis TaxID=587633 RepID=A0ABT9WRP8_9BACI|nr:hypothetical protein [Bacillus chungangensis]MDQ0175425.1 hypothetical protein [Bacillus chungangensis]
MLTLPKYETLATRPIFEEVKISAIGENETLVSGLDIQILKGLVSEEVFVYEGNVKALKWSSLNGNDAFNNDKVYLINSNCSHVANEIKNNLGSEESIDLATVFIDWD